MQDTAVEQFLGKPNVVVPGSTVDAEFLDQGKQTKRVHVPDGIGLPEPLGVGSNGKSLVETRNGGNVPRVTGQGACTEAVCVISEIGDDCFDDL